MSNEPYRPHHNSLMEDHKKMQRKNFREVWKKYVGLKPVPDDVVDEFIKAIEV